MIGSILKLFTKTTYETFSQENKGVMKLGLGKAKPQNPSSNLNPEPIVATRLRELCGGDNDLYAAMSRLMFLDPKKIMTTLERVLSEAEEYGAQGNKLRAEVAYRIAGGISLFRGDLDGVNKYFAKAASFAGDSHPEYSFILKRSSEAVSIARKYYEEFESSIIQPR